MKKDIPAQPERLTGAYVLFIDVSVDPRCKLGVGASIILPVAFLKKPLEDLERSDVASQVVVQRFEETSSTTLEVQAVVRALEEYGNSPKAQGADNLVIYTDSQCVAGLPGRRRRLEHTGFASTRTHRLLRNAALYRAFYELSDQLGIEVVKVEGHTRTSSRNTVDHIFSIIDKEARKNLKLLQKELQEKTTGRQ